MQDVCLHHIKLLRYGCVRLLLPILAFFLNGAAPLSAAPSVEAYSGGPFGVARVTIDVFRGQPSVPLSDERFTVWQEDNLAMYPVVKQETAKRLLRQLLSIETPRKISIYFLFQGDQPFDVSVFSHVEQAVRVRPIADSRRHGNLLNEWWNEYSGRWKGLCSDPQFPPMAENFLVATLSRRLGLSTSAGGGLLAKKEPKVSALAQLFASESYQLKLDRDRVIHPQVDEGPLQPLPETPAWPEYDIDLAALEGVELAPIATRVPEECFYIRFTKFLNYLWFRDLTEKWQGDLQNMIVRRAIERAADKRTQQQLSLKYNAMAKILGPRVVNDIAIVGLDPYSTHGAAVGVVMHAKNNFLLSQDMMRQRRRSLTEFDDAAETTETIAGEEVSLVSTPGGEVRSYYVQQGDFHMVATSKTLIERFIQTGEGDRPLSSLPSFLQARKQLTATGEDTVSVFVSEKFFQNLCSPHYFVENLRRIKSAREPLLIELASLAAQTENAPQNDPMLSGILPEGFGTRVDGSQLDIVEESLVDSRRGAPGYFVPIADMTVEQVSESEAQAYRTFLDSFRDEVGQMPPVAAVVRRQPQEGDTVTMSLEVLVQPTTGSKVNELKKHLSTPSSERLAPVEGNVLSFEAALETSLLSRDEPSQFHLFGGLRDYLSPLAASGGSLRPLGGYSEIVRGYLGAWPKPRLLESMLSKPVPESEEPQVVQEVLGAEVWANNWDDFITLHAQAGSCQRSATAASKAPAERPAQIWLEVDDLTGKQFAGTVNAFGYMRARETSVAASRMMNSLANQFRIGRPECRELAERLIDGKFVCPLGGEYELLAPERDLEVWVSTALEPSNRFLLTEVPEDFQLPFLDWFRGLEADASLTGDALSIQLDLHMTADAVPE